MPHDADLRAMLITAGFGTRLAPLTDRLPKPAVPVANRPAAWFALDHLHRLGIRNFVANTHHLARELEATLRAVAPSDLQLRFVHEPEILGTAGGVRNAWQPRPNETFVVMNGKYVFAPDLVAALALHRSQDAYATMIVRDVPVNDPAAVVHVDDVGAVRAVPGSPAADGGNRRVMYTGVSLLSARVHAALPEQGCLIRDGYARWIARGERVISYTDNSSFRDVGMSLAHYHEANLALAAGRASWPGIGPVSADHMLLADGVTRGADVQLRDSVVGAGAVLAPGSQLERCVVWPGARVSGVHRDAIVLTDGHVVPVPKPLM